MSKWADIMNDYSDGIETVIVGWELEDDEDGVTIAVVIHETKEVEYKDEVAKTDEYAQRMIKEVMENL